MLFRGNFIKAVSVCVSVRLALSCQKHGLKYICDLFEIEHTDFFYSCIFDVKYTIVSDTSVSFFTSNLIRVEFKFNWFLVFSGYRCHGNIDFPKRYIISNFNTIPISGVNFVHWSEYGKFAKRPSENVWYGPEKTVERHLKRRILHALNSAIWFGACKMRRLNQALSSTVLRKNAWNSG